MERPIQSAAYMPPPVRTLIIFGDIVYNFQSDLQQLLHLKDNANLVDFFARAAFAFRHEFASLPYHEQDWLPRFTNLIDLLENFSTVKAAPVVRFALLCLYQIGRFIQYFGKDSAVYPAQEKTYLLGICTGSFAAAAISTSQSIVELIPAGVEAVIRAFRIGLHSFRLQQDLERSPCGGSWSAVVNLEEKDAIEVIQRYINEKGTPSGHRPFVSAVGPSNVTISGLPAQLRSLFKSTTARVHTLPVTTPFHADHLFSCEDVDRVAAGPSPDTLRSYRLRIPIISPATGALIKEGNFESLLRQAAHFTLREQVRWDRIGKSCVDLIESDNYEGCTILPCATNASAVVATSLSSVQTKNVTVNDILNTTVNTSPPMPSTGRFSDSKIAIVGFSGRYPDASSNDEFWELLRSGKDTHRIIPKDRFDWEAHFDASGSRRNTSRVKHGCFIDEPGMFDARFFHLSPREAEDTDPAQRLALMTTYEALEMAGFVADRTPSSQRDRVGVFYGTTSDDWREVNSGQDVGTYFIPGGNRAFVPGRITFFHRFSGPSISVDTACSSSFAALNIACQTLWQGVCDTAIAGGTNILTNPDNFAGLDKGHFLSTIGNCNPFDNDANGYCRADAVASLVLKRLKDAEADNDPVFGVIAGVNTNHCGQTVSITRPHEGDQVTLFKQILRQTNTNPLDVSYVEMHGTGTQSGDATEMSSVLSAMVPGRGRAAQHPLHLGAVKANIGHSESASGVSALIKVLMMMQHNEIPPHIGIKKRINRNYPSNLTERNVHIAFKPTPWRKADCPGGKRVSFLNNFSAAGGNTAVLLEDPPETRHLDTQSDIRTLHPVVVSANSVKSLNANINALVEYLDKNSKTPLSALSYTTTARRTHHKFRASCVASDITSVSAAFKKRLSENKAVSAIPPVNRRPTVVFTFTGQGTLYAGLGKQLFQIYSSFRDDIIRFDGIARQHGFPSFLPLVESKPQDLVIDEVETVVAHVTLVCVQMALYRLWISWGITPDYAIGHSLGEYPALFAAGVLSASDTIYLVGARADLLARHCVKGSHSMLAVKAPLHEIERTISSSSCDVACANSPVNTVVSGPNPEIDRVTESLRAEGFECIPLSIPYAFHSAQVDSWTEEFELAASRIEYQPPVIPYMSPLLQRTVSAKETGVLNGAYLSRACRGTVNYLGAIEAARKAGIVGPDTHWLEIGSHPACSTFIKRTMGPSSITVPSLRQARDPWETLVPAAQVFYLSGFDIHWSEYHRNFPSAHQTLPLPNYRWDLKKYWIAYRGNFCLTKGDVAAQPQKPAVAPEVSYLSSSLHRILEEHHEARESTLLTESNIRDPRLYPILKGHKVNQAVLCPSSLYADMALTAVRYMIRSLELSAEEKGLNCADMKIELPLVATYDTQEQMLRLSAKAHWSRNEVSLTIFSVDPKTEKISNHASCTVKVTQAPASLLMQEWKRIGHLVRARIQSLQSGVTDGHCHKLRRGLAYRLFSSLVEYSNDYQGMQEVVLNTDEFEACAQVVFQTPDNGFDWNPCWIDSLGHIAGFIMNGNDNMHSRDYVFVNHGWSDIRCAKKMEYGKTYQTYNKMQPDDDKGTTYSGDTYILEDGAVIAVFGGVKFRRVPRAVLGRLLPVNIQSDTTTLQQCSPAVQIQSPPRQQKAERIKVVKPQLVENDVPSKLTTILSEEAGLDLAELDMHTPFTDYGIDSLLSLTISSRLQEEAGVNLSSSAFLEFATMAELVHYLVPEGTGPQSSLDSSASASSDEHDNGNETDATSVANDACDTGAVIRATIAEEAGVALDELTPTTDFAEIGLDSLLSLTIIDKLLGRGIKLSAKILADSHNIRELETAIARLGSSGQPRPAILSVQQENGPPYAGSVRLQGSSGNAQKTLFLFPDGAGAATSYLSLPPISPDVVVYGLNCPWMKRPQDMCCDLPRYVSKFIHEIRRRQPVGPYYFGGWSAGGILAYEAAQQLARNGECTAKLVLLDSPDPIGIQSPPQRMYDFLESQDMFGLRGRKAPDWLRPHFTAFIAMLDQYNAEPFVGEEAPATQLIYARDGLCKGAGAARPEERPDDPREMRWLLNERTEFHGGGWRRLVGAEKLQVNVVDDANHYTLLADGDPAGKVSAIVAECLAG